MGAAVYERERRSTRVFVRVRVVAAGKDSRGRRYRQACESIVVSAHGGLIYLAPRVELHALLTLTNPFTQQEQECRVVYLGDESEKGRRVGVEFLTPAPHFWGMEFCPADWPARSPVASEASQS